MAVLRASRTKQNIWLNNGFFLMEYTYWLQQLLYRTSSDQTDKVVTICTLSREYDVIFLPGL